MDDDIKALFKLCDKDGSGFLEIDEIFSAGSAVD